MEANANKIDFSRTIYEIKRHWYYYAISFVLIMGAAGFYLYKKNSVYLFHVNMLIEQDNGSSNTGMVQMMQSFTMGSFGGGTVDDEILVVQSHSLLCDLVSELKLNRLYVEKEGVKSHLLYNNSPVEILAPDELFDTLAVGASLSVDLKQNGLADVKVKQGLFKTVHESEDNKLPMTITLPTGGVFVLDKTPLFKDGEERHLRIYISGNNSMAEFYSRELIIDYASKKSNGITCSLEDVDLQRGKDILNKVLELYNRRRMNDQNEKAQNEVSFIEERLSSLTGQLQNSERELEAFKTENNVTDIGEEAKVLLAQTSANRVAIVQLQTQLSIFDMIMKFLQDPKNRYSMIPVTSGVDYESAARSIETYNELVLKRMEMDMSAKKDNKALQALNSQIDGMRSGVMETMQKARESAEIAYQDFLREDGKFAVRLKDLPSHERKYVSLMRDQTVMNELYIFLLQQRESSALKMGANAPLGRIVDEAYYDTRPVAPDGLLVIVAALFLSLLFPTLRAVYRTVRAKKILMKADVARFTQIPVASEVEHCEEELDFEQSTRATESIRQIRNFLMEKEAKTVLLTSLSEGEGRKFIIGNVGKLFALMAKRTVIVDMGIGRNDFGESLSLSGQKGVADYITDNKVAVADVIASNGYGNGIDVVPASSKAGHTPEMLLTDRFFELLERLESEYDMILLYAPTFELNTAIARLAKSTDVTLVVLRGGQSRKTYIQRFSKSVGNLIAEKTAIVINNVKL